jgi:hypothetical protein
MAAKYFINRDTYVEAAAREGIYTVGDEEDAVRRIRPWNRYKAEIQHTVAQ